MKALILIATLTATSSANAAVLKLCVFHDRYARANLDAPSVDTDPAKSKQFRVGNFTFSIHDSENSYQVEIFDTKTHARAIQNFEYNATALRSFLMTTTGPADLVCFVN